MANVKKPNNLGFRYQSCSLDQTKGKLLRRPEIEPGLEGSYAHYYTTDALM